VIRWGSEAFYGFRWARETPKLVGGYHQGSLGHVSLSQFYLPSTFAAGQTLPPLRPLSLSNIRGIAISGCVIVAHIRPESGCTVERVQVHLLVDC